jgi:hypothetical protein
MKETAVRISHPKNLKIQDIKSPGKMEIVDGQLDHFLQESPEERLFSILFQLEEGQSFNSITFELIDLDKNFGPDTFKFEISHDGVVWEAIIQEYEFSRTNAIMYLRHFSLVSANYIKLVIRPSRKNKDNLYKICFSNFRVMVSGIVNLSVSSENDRYWVKENLIDLRPDYGWASKEKATSEEEYFSVDLGSVNRVEEIRMLTRDGADVNFPTHLQFYYSEDNLSWHYLFEESNFFAEKATWYRWRFLPTNMRFFKTVCVNEKPNSSKKYQCQIVEFEMYATPDMLDLSRKKNIADMPPYSTIIRSGLVRLAVDGEINPGVAVQGSDRRLRDANTEFKGIVELATDGEDRPNVVVQGNDKRLKNASETAFGLVKLARSGENRPGLVVQSDDERLKNATTDYPGIVELAENGETRPGAVVQGNDDRLKKGTTNTFGLVILSELGASVPGRVVTADDPRIKKATTEAEGILRFATNGEESQLAAVQGNDKRIKKATTETLGIVELAHSGEDKPGVVVQGNDKRLRYATEEEQGLSLFAKHGVKVPLKSVQADDPRLYDSREAKPHTHNYAPIQHEYNSHTGLIRLTGSSSAGFKNIVSPPQNHSVIVGKNEAEDGSGILGIGKTSGLVGFGEENGVQGLSNGDKEGSAGVAGFSKQGYGGFFISTRNYGLCVNGSGSTQRDIEGSGKAIYAKGESEFQGIVRVIDEKGNDCIARFFKTAQSEVISYGDLIIISDKDEVVTRCKTPYSTKVIGVSVETSSISLGEKQSTAGNYILVAMYGVVNMNVDASEGHILPGDLLVSGLTGGHAIKANTDKLKVGMPVGRALAECKKDRGSIPVVLCG